MSDKRLLMRPNLAQFTLNFTYLDQQCRNVLYAIISVESGPEPHWDGPAMHDMAGHIASEYHASFMPLAAHDCTLDSISCVGNQESGVGPLIGAEFTDSPLPASGGESGDGAANNVTLAIKLSTALLGRSNHGRFYFVGINSGLFNATQPNRLKAGSLSDMRDACDSFQNALAAATVAETKTGSLAVASFVSGGSPRAETVAHVVTHIGPTDDIFDSQRRRLPGRGI